MRVIRNGADVDASAARVWSVLTDLAAYREWNPFVVRASGALAVGATLDVTFAPPGGRAMQFRPVVVRLVPERELAWAAKLLVPGLFDGEHAFRIEPLAADRTRLVQVARFDGWVVPLLPWKTGPGLRAGFAAMVAALKSRAES
ncbi:MAG: SRPBCC domain-containing protein [bacterium]